MYTHRKNFWRTHGFTCLTGLLLLFALKLYYSRTDCDGLLWILAPTAWWIHTLSGISFEYLPHAGYVNHSFRFVIAASFGSSLRLSFSSPSFLESGDKRKVWDGSGLVSLFLIYLPFWSMAFGYCFLSICRSTCQTSINIIT